MNRNHVVADDQPANLLFKLQPELRNRIYELVLTSPTVYLLALFRFSKKKYAEDPRKLFPGFPVQPSLVRTCREIRGEALAMFYANNRFAILDFCPRECESAINWLTAIGASNRAYVKRISVPGREPECEAGCFDFMKAIPGWSFFETAVEVNKGQQLGPEDFSIIEIDSFELWLANNGR